MGRKETDQSCESLAKETSLEVWDIIKKRVEVRAKWKGGKVMLYLTIANHLMKRADEELNKTGYVKGRAPPDGWVEVYSPEALSRMRRTQDSLHSPSPALRVRSCQGENDHVLGDGLNGRK
jgi:hypothetical protein